MPTIVSREGIGTREGGRRERREGGERKEEGREGERREEGEREGGRREEGGRGRQGVD